MPRMLRSRVKFDLPLASFQDVAKKVHTDADEREKFIKNPAGYLKANGISLPKELLPSSNKVRNLLEKAHDPGTVAIAV